MSHLKRKILTKKKTKGQKKKFNYCTKWVAVTAWIKWWSTTMIHIYRGVIYIYDISSPLLSGLCTELQLQAGPQVESPSLEAMRDFPSPPRAPLLRWLKFRAGQKSQELRLLVSTIVKKKELAKYLKNLKMGDHGSKCSAGHQGQSTGDQERPAPRRLSPPWSNACCHHQPDRGWKRCKERWSRSRP